MTEQSNSTPSWARKTQSNSTKWGAGAGIVAAVVIGGRILLGVLGVAMHAGSTPSSNTPGMTYNAFGAPSAEEMRTFARANDAAVDSDVQNFEGESKALAAGKPLSPEALFRPGGIAAAETVLARERAVVDKYQALSTQRKADMRVRLAAMYSDPDRKQRALAAFDVEDGADQVNMAEYWRLQHEIVDREQALVTSLARARGSWRPMAGKVMFINSGMRQAYQRDVDGLRATEAQLDGQIALVNGKNAQARAQRRATLGD